MWWLELINWVWLILVSPLLVQFVVALANCVWIAFRQLNELWSYVDGQD